jgi:hypothetical protein
LFFAATFFSIRIPLLPNDGFLRLADHLSI